MRILYLADTRFPLERANGIQTFETCRALAARGHMVTLIVRPDTADPPRDPWVFYGAARERASRSSATPTIAGPYAGLLPARGFAENRLADRRLVFTRDLGWRRSQYGSAPACVPV